MSCSQRPRWRFQRGWSRGAASAAPATPVKFTGSISGNLSGKITISPPLTTSASTGPVKFTTTATLSKITGSKTQKGVTLTGGKWTAVVTAPKGTSCSTLESGTLPSGPGKVTYTSTGGTATPSTITFKSETLASTSPVTVDLNKGATTGSFTTASGSSGVLHIDQSVSTLLTDCSTTGLSTISFTGKTGVSTMHIG